MGYTHLMSIRGDNYCAVRSTLFQTFCIRDFGKCAFLANMKQPQEALKVSLPYDNAYWYSRTLLVRTPSGNDKVSTSYPSVLYIEIHINLQIGYKISTS